MRSVLRILTLTTAMAMLLAATGDDAGMQLAKNIFDASGGKSFTGVTRMVFTCNVEQNGKTIMTSKHDLDVRGNTDNVAWEGKTVLLHLDAKDDSSDAKAARERWNQDGYLLLMPFKLLGEGVKLESGGSQEIEGQTLDVLKVSFEQKDTGPADQLKLFADPTSHMVKRWEFGDGDKKQLTTWEEYKQFGPLTLATRHRAGEKTITFTDVVVSTER